MKTESLQLRFIPNMLSVDLENWHENSCEPEVDYLLNLFSTFRAKATFFVLQTVAETEPGLIKKIDNEGHEIACHGGTHEQIFKKNRQTFFEEIKQSIGILSAITGKKILGYRAPHFSIFEGTYWALDVLSELGIKYDSSIFPFAGPRYGVPDFPRYPVHVHLERGSIIEVPLSTVHHFHRNWPVSGGGYFRLLPYALIRRAVREINREGIPFVVYCHPYEFSVYRLSCFHDIKELGWLRAQMNEIRYNLLRKSMRRKLSHLIDEFTFCSFKEALGNEFTN
jgi:polysaccharide deacetylase family protein (PEP-CTERM system associated)